MNIDTLRSKIIYEFEEGFELIEGYDLNRVIRGYEYVGKENELIVVKLDSEEEVIYLDEEVTLDVKTIEQLLKYRDIVENIICDNKFEKKLTGYNITIDILYEDENINTMSYECKHNFKELDIVYQGKTLYAIFKEIPIVINIDPTFSIKDKTIISIQMKVKDTIDLARVLDDLKELINNTIKNVVEKIILGGNEDGTSLESI